MVITLSEITPIGLCITTEELFDVKRFQRNFCDNMILRVQDKDLTPMIMSVKRDLTSLINQKKFLEGHKTAIISNIDKILSLASSRYSHIDLRLLETVLKEGKELIKKTILAKDFNTIADLEPIFKSKISLPVYKLFIESMKRTRTSVL